jgi:hypothetical protein
MKIALLTVTIVLAAPLSAHAHCFSDPEGNIRCLNGRSMYNMGNGLYGDLAGNRIQIETTSPPRSSNWMYNQLMNPNSQPMDPTTAAKCRSFPMLCQ